MIALVKVTTSSQHQTGLISMLVLLDLSATFDTTSLHHYILLQWMEHQTSIKLSALRWFKTYLSDKYNFVHVNDELSRYDKVSHGVPQGSVLGPLHFTLYTTTVRNLGFIFDQEQSFNSHIKQISRTAFFHLCCIAKIKQILS